MNITITPSPQVKALIAKLGRSSDIVKQATKAGLQKGSDIFILESKQKAPVDTGNLRRNIQSKIQGDTAIISVDPKINYAPYQEYGTGIYVGRGVIRPKRAKVLRFTGKKGVVFTKYVRGVRGKFYMRAGSKKVLEQSHKINQTIYNELSKGLSI